MKLSEYAEQHNVTYRTAWNRWKAGLLPGRALKTGTIILEDIPGPSLPNACLIYCRISPLENEEELTAQAARLRTYAREKGYEIYKVIKEVGSGVDDMRESLEECLKDIKYNKLLVEHKGRLARIGLGYIQTLLDTQGKELEVVSYDEGNKADLAQDFINTLTRYCREIYGEEQGPGKVKAAIDALAE